MKLRQPSITPPARWPTPKPQIQDEITRYCLGLPPTPPPPPVLSLPAPLAPRSPVHEPELIMLESAPDSITDQFEACLRQRVTVSQGDCRAFAAFGAFIDAPFCAY